MVLDELVAYVGLVGFIRNIN